MITTGVIVFAAGVAGLTVSVIVSIIVFRSDSRKAKMLRQQIWNEYK